MVETAILRGGALYHDDSSSLLMVEDLFLPGGSMNLLVLLIINQSESHNGQNGFYSVFWLSREYLFFVLEHFFFFFFSFLKFRKTNPPLYLQSPSKWSHLNERGGNWNHAPLPLSHIWSKSCLMATYNNTRLRLFVKQKNKNVATPTSISCSCLWLCYQIWKRIGRGKYFCKALNQDLQ